MGRQHPDRLGSIRSRREGRHHRRRGPHQSELAHVTDQASRYVPPTVWEMECPGQEVQVVYNGSTTAEFKYGDMTAAMPSGTRQSSPDLPIWLEDDPEPMRVALLRDTGRVPLHQLAERPGRRVDHLQHRSRRSPHLDNHVRRRVHDRILRRERIDARHDRAIADTTTGTATRTIDNSPPAPPRRDDSDRSEVVR